MTLPPADSATVSSLSEEVAAASAAQSQYDAEPLPASRSPAALDHSWVSNTASPVLPRAPAAATAAATEEFGRGRAPHEGSTTSPERGAVWQSGNSALAAASTLVEPSRPSVLAATAQPVSAGAGVRRGPT